MTLEIQNLNKRFGSTQALDDMSFTVLPGELYGFVGSNGAGKTTTMRIILGVLESDSGKVLRDGKELTFEDRKVFGYMPEERGLYPRMPVADQLIYFAKLHGLDKAKASEQMEYWTERLGIAARRGDEVQALSLGNQQRVQLATALIADPQVLVLDEPFSGLDPIAVADMSTVLRERADAGATVVFSSHQLELVEQLCDRVGIASLGKIAAQGTIDELRDSGQSHHALEVGDPVSVARALGELGIQSEIEGNTVKASLDQHDPQQALTAALALGPVHSFTRVRPHLNELFGTIVKTPEPQQEPAKKPGFFARLGGKK